MPGKIRLRTLSLERASVGAGSHGQQTCKLEQEFHRRAQVQVQELLLSQVHKMRPGMAEPGGTGKQGDRKEPLDLHCAGLPGSAAPRVLGVQGREDCSGL